MPESSVATDSEQLTRRPEAKKVSAFDSNQWNSAVGGVAGGKVRGRRALRYSGRGESTESYAEIRESGFFVADDARLSTFAADVDTASYANVRRLLGLGQKPAEDAVRVEEFVNAMDYRDPEPRGNEPFAVTSEVAPCPWTEGHELLRIGLKTREIDASKVPPCNLVFLIDVSGSMRSEKKLPLVKRAMGLLVDQMRLQDRVAIVTYAGRVGVPLESTSGDEHDKIHAVLTNLRTGGGTNGQGGIQRAYEIAAQNRVDAGINRVILCTDGDFNVGIKEPDALEKFIAAKRDTGVFLTVLGVGGGNLKDDRLERLANKGNGVYAYLDTLAEGRRVLVEQFGASMMTVAKDVKLQVEFDPKRVAGYRLIGYENRVMAAKDFRDDKKDAGEIGAGHAMTALYEIVPFGLPVPGTEVVKTATANTTAHQPNDRAVATLRLRYKPPHGDTAREKTFALGAGNGEGGGVGQAPSRDHRLASAAAAFGMLLRGSKHLGQFGWADLAAMIDDADLGAPGLRAAVDQARKVLTD
ncbi:MAG: von Willebrand factor type A domain-containing protein [bacterium]|nr:von Willebrand factor type A domain-containing protein [bacterium]